MRSCGGRLTGAPLEVVWRVTAIVVVVGTVVSLWAHLRWENHLRTLVGVPETWTGAVLPARVATVVGAQVVVLVAQMLVTGVLGDRVLGRLDAAFIVINDEFRADLPAPTSPHLSGGPASAENWDDLGRQGRVFVTNAPSREEIASFTGQPARQPVRAYVGVGDDHEVDLQQEATRALRELELAGGFDRAVINVATGTGRGWINENQTQGLEYLWNDDTATVSMQYSYLPSWLAFLVDESRSPDAGCLLCSTIYARWSELPARERPMLVVSGESLGSFGGEAAFDGYQDLAQRTDGALFVGPTANNTLWSRFTTERDPRTRVGYLQHADDPITWWDWSLAWRAPDWLDEPRGRAASPSIRWIPGVTMLQLAVDQAVANDVPPGQGHQFGQAPVCSPGPASCRCRGGARPRRPASPMRWRPRWQPASSRRRCTPRRPLPRLVPCAPSSTPAIRTSTATTC